MNLDRLKWRLVDLWNDPAKTGRAGAGNLNAEYDNLGALSRFKRTPIPRWRSQSRVSDKHMGSSTTPLKEGGGDPISYVEHKEPEQAAQFMRTAAIGDLPGGKLEVPTVPVTAA